MTSLQAAALRDVLTTLRRRAPHVPVVVYPVPVQGAGASERIAAMLERVNARAEVDVIILCRAAAALKTYGPSTKSRLHVRLVHRKFPLWRASGMRRM